METWQNAIVQAASALLGGPKPGVEFGVAAGVALFVLAVILNQLTHLMSLPLSGVWRAAAVGLVGVCLVLLVVAAAQIYLAGTSWVVQWRLERWLPFLVVPLVLAVAVAPLMRLTHGSRYGSSLTALLLAAIAVAAAVALTRSAQAAVAKGGQGVGGALIHKRDVEAAQEAVR